jgi:hypothetical protein
MHPDDFLHLQFTNVLSSSLPQTLVPWGWKKFFNILTRGLCYKNTMVNYCGNLNPTFSRVKMTLKSYLGLKNIIAFLG